jgi:glycosyltransferase involved in cell wall biosynthesis
MLAEREIRILPGRVRSRVGAIGFLGTLSEEKGIWDFLAVINELRARNFGLQVHIAGPVADTAARIAIAELVTADQKTRYWGSVYRSDKVRFLDSVDVLLFPSRYSHEAEPLVVYEALAAGIPVVTTGRGCLRTLVPASGVFVVQDGVNFATRATDMIAGWLRDPASFTAASADARQHFVNGLELADREVAIFLAQIVSEVL